MGERFQGLSCKPNVECPSKMEENSKERAYLRTQGTYEKSPSEQDSEVRGEHQKTKSPLLPAKKRVCLRNKLNGFCSLIKLGQGKNMLAVRTHVADEEKCLHAQRGHKGRNKALWQVKRRRVWGQEEANRQGGVKQK